MWPAIVSFITPLFQRIGEYLPVLTAFFVGRKQAELERAVAEAERTIEVQAAEADASAASARTRAEIIRELDEGRF